LFSRKHTQRKLLVLHFALLVERRRVWSATVACFHSRLNGNFIVLGAVADASPLATTRHLPLT